MPRVPTPPNLGRDLSRSISTPSISTPSISTRSSSAPVVELDRVPSLGPLYARGAAGSVRAAAGRGGALRPSDLPTTRLVVRGVQAEAEHLTAYQHLLGETASDVLPAGFVHVLTFPVSIDLMARRDFPLPLLGTVHLANRITQHRPVRLGEQLDLTVHAENLAAHRSGVAVDLVAEVRVGEEPVWHGVSTYIAKGYRMADASPTEASPTDVSDLERTPGGSPADTRAPFTPPAPTGRWRLAADLGRRYAEVSGDRNPIHLSSLAAKAFGFPRTIAHGMYTASRALADVGPGARGGAFVWEVDFGKPVLLPSTVDVRVAPSAQGSGLELLVWDGKRSRRHLSGSVRPLA